MIQIAQIIYTRELSAPKDLYLVDRGMRIRLLQLGTGLVNEEGVQDEPFHTDSTRKTMIQIGADHVTRDLSDAQDLDREMDAWFTKRDELMHYLRVCSLSGHVTNVP